MPDLFGNAQLPPWLVNTPSPSAIVDRAFQARDREIRNFSDLAQLKMQQRQQEALLPLQVQAQQQKIASGALDIAGQQLAQEHAISSKAGIIDLATRLQDTTDWSNPESVNNVWRAVKANPSLAMTPSGQKLIAQAEAMHQVATIADTRLKAAETAAQARIDSVTTAAEARTKDLAAKLKSAEDIAADRNKTILEKEDRENKANFELAKMKWSMQPPGFDVLSRAQLALWHAQVKKLADADPTMSAKDFNVQAETAYQKFIKQHNIEAPKIQVNQPAAPASGPTMPKTQAEFDAIPIGSEYINPADGKKYKKLK